MPDGFMNLHGKFHPGRPGTPFESSVIPPKLAGRRKIDNWGVHIHVFLFCLISSS